VPFPYVSDIDLSNIKRQQHCKAATC